MSNMAMRANAVVMLGLLVGGGAMSLGVMATKDVRTAMLRPYPGYDYVNGHLTTAIEGSYKKVLPLRERSVNVLNAVTLTLFDEGRKGVVVGEDGWLFSAEEYDWTPRSDRNLVANLDQIVEIVRQLQTAGVAVEIALVPEKADIYSGRLLRPRPSEHAGKYESVRTALVQRTGVAVPDLRAALLAGVSRAEMFFPTDTHWSVAGAGLAAQTLARAFPALADVPETHFDLSAQPSVPYEGDLLAFLDLGPFSGLLPATDDHVTPLAARAESGNVGDLLGDVADAPPVVLVGTSYSANPLWSFEPQLKSALGRDVLNLAEVGRGPFAPMRGFLDRLGQGQLHPRAVIWEIPIRYLDDDPNTIPQTNDTAI